MKKKKVIIVLSSIAIFIYGQLFSQDIKKEMVFNEKSEKSSFELMGLVPGTIKKTVIPANDKVTIKFKKEFPKATEQAWYSLDENLLVKFKEDNQNAMAVINPRGRILYQSKEINEKQLPQDVKTIIDDDYANFVIKKAMMAHSARLNKTAYVFTLESATRIAVIRVIDSEVQELKMLERADK